MALGKPNKILESLIKRYSSMREFARTIGEDTTDIIYWKTGKRKICGRAVVKIVKIHPEILPFELNPEMFPENLDFHFRK